jgi:hypothetical protein
VNDLNKVTRGDGRSKWVPRVIVFAVLLSAATALGASVRVAGDQPSSEDIQKQIDEWKRDAAAQCGNLENPELRVCDEEFQRRFAQIGFVATPHEIVNSPDAPFPFPLGIFDTEEAWSLYNFKTYWNGMIQGQRVSVFAGKIQGTIADSDDPAYPPKGGVVVIPYGEGPSKLYETPTPTTMVRIESSDGSKLTLIAPDGARFTFDSALRTYLPAVP